MNYILIIVLTVVALSGTAYIIWHAVNSPPFDLELSMGFETKKGVQCVANELINKNIPHEIVEFNEKEWIVLQVIEDKTELQSILENRCSAFKSKAY